MLYPAVPCLWYVRLSDSYHPLYLTTSCISKENHTTMGVETRAAAGAVAGMISGPNSRKNPDIQQKTYKVQRFTKQPRERTLY
jgi:hypothetical protein